MTRVILKKPRAIRDLHEHFNFIASDRVSAARRFLKQVRSTLDSLARFPGIGRVFETDDPLLQEVRVTTVKSFRNYLVFYRASNDALEVLTILHGARNLPNLLARISSQEFN